MSTVNDKYCLAVLSRPLSDVYCVHANCASVLAQIASFVSVVCAYKNDLVYE